MTVTVPTLALVLPAMFIWFGIGMGFAIKDWRRRVQQMLAEGDTRNRRIVREVLGTYWVWFFWPVPLAARAWRLS